MSASSPAPARSGHHAFIQAVRGARHFDSGLVSFAGGLLAAVPVAAVLGIGLALGQRVPAVTAAAGAMLVGIAWRVTGGRPPLALMALDALIMAVSTFVGCVTGSVLWLHLIVLCLWAGTGGLLVALGNRGGIIGNQAIIAVAVFGRFSQPAPAALGLAALVLTGGAAQVAFLTLVRWPPPLRGQRAAVAAAYRALSELARGAEDSSSLPAATTLDEAATSLASSSLFGDAAVMTLRTLVSEGHRLRVALIALHGLRRQSRTAIGAPGVTDVAGELDRALALTADILGLAAQAVDGDQHVAEQLEGRVREVSEIAERVDAVASSGGGGVAGSTVQIARRLEALAGQLRAIGSLAPPAGRGGGLRSRGRHQRTNQPRERLRGDIAALRDNMSLQSSAGRHSVRLAIVVPLAALFVHEVPVQRGYWVIVAAATVLRPEFGATFTRGTQRAVGTSLGVALAGLITVALHPAGGVIVLIVFALALAGYSLFPASFAVGFAFITALVVFLLDAVSSDTLTTASARLLDTLIGGAIGLIVYAAWPTWSRTTAWQALSDLIEAGGRYLDGVLDAIIAGRRAAEPEMRPLARGTRVARTNAEAVVARSLSEPPGRRIDPARSQAALGAMRRLVQAAHVLRLDAQDERERRPLPELAPIRRDTATLLRIVAQALVTASGAHAHPGSPPDLRARYGAFRRNAGRDSEALALLAELDEIVDAANALATIIGVIDEDAADEDGVARSPARTAPAPATT